MKRKGEKYAFRRKKKKTKNLVKESPRKQTEATFHISDLIFFFFYYG